MVILLSVNSYKKSSIMLSFVVLAVAVALVGSSLSADAGQARLDSSRTSSVAAKHAPIVVIPGPDGNALVTGEGQFTSANWSGYVLPEFITHESYISAQATWVVPTVVFKKKPAVSSNWVGIGGFCKNSQCTKVDRTLIQLGTAHEALSRTQDRLFRLVRNATCRLNPDLVGRESRRRDHRVTQLCGKLHGHPELDAFDDERDDRPKLEPSISATRLRISRQNGLKKLPLAAAESCRSRITASRLSTSR